MKTNCYRAVVCLLLALCAISVRAQKPQPFSADVVITSPKGQDVTGKFYVAMPKIRMDMDQHGQNMSVITDAAAQTSLVIMHQQHMYMEMPVNQKNPMLRNMPKLDSYDPQNPCAKTEMTCKKVGTETVNGRVCDKWLLTQKDGKTTTAWVDQKLFFAMKILNADGGGMEFRNIKEGSPSASTFEVPAGYQKMNIGGMLGAQH